MLFPLNPGPLTGPGTINGWAVTSYFGGRVDPLTGRVGTHGGMDLAFSGCTGQPMIAVADGWLSQSWDPSGGGNWNGLTATNGDYYGYGHAQAFEPTGGRQRNVKAGEVIGYVGTTGGSTGPHLHFAYRPRGSFVYRDPYDLLIAATSAPPTTSTTPDKDWFDMATAQDITDAVNAAFTAHPPVAPGAGGHPVVQINGQLWYITEDDGVVKRRWISGPVELKFLRDTGIVQTGPISNLGPGVEGEFYSTPRLPVDETGNLGPADAPGGV